MLHLLGEEAFFLVFPIAGIGEWVRFAHEEGPVHGAPVVEPEALELDHLAMGGGDAVVGRGREAEALDEARRDDAMAGFR